MSKLTMKANVATAGAGDSEIILQTGHGGCIEITEMPVGRGNYTQLQQDNERVIVRIPVDKRNDVAQFIQLAS